MKEQSPRHPQQHEQSNQDTNLPIIYGFDRYNPSMRPGTEQPWQLGDTVQNGEQYATLVGENNFAFHTTSEVPERIKLQVAAAQEIAQKQAEAAKLEEAILAEANRVAAVQAAEMAVESARTIPADPSTDTQQPDRQPTRVDASADNTSTPPPAYVPEDVIEGVIEQSSGDNIPQSSNDEEIIDAEILDGTSGGEADPDGTTAEPPISLSEIQELLARNARLLEENNRLARQGNDNTQQIADQNTEERDKEENRQREFRLRQQASVAAQTYYIPPMGEVMRGTPFEGTPLKGGRAYETPTPEDLRKKVFLEAAIVARKQGTITPALLKQSITNIISTATERQLKRHEIEFYQGITDEQIAQSIKDLEAKDLVRKPAFRTKVLSKITRKTLPALQAGYEVNDGLDANNPKSIGFSRRKAFGWGSKTHKVRSLDSRLAREHLTDNLDSNSGGHN